MPQAIGVPSSFVEGASSGDGSASAKGQGMTAYIEDPFLAFLAPMNVHKPER